MGSPASVPIALPRHQRKLKDKNRSGRGADRKERLREPYREKFVCHVPSP